MEQELTALAQRGAGVALLASALLLGAAPVAAQGSAGGRPRADDAGETDDDAAEGETDESADEGETDEGEPDEASEEARRIFQRGDRAYAEGDYDQAAADFKKAFEMSRLPELQYNLANAYERAGRLQEAVDALAAYVPYAPKAQQPTIRKRIESLKARMAREAAAPGPTPTPTPAPGPTPAPATTPPPESDGSPGPSLPWLGIGLTSVGGAALIAGGVLGVVALGQRGDASDACVDGICDASAQGAIADDRTFSLAADISFAVGGVAAVTGIVFLLLHDYGGPEQSARSAARAAAWQPPIDVTVTAGGGAVTFRGAF